MVRNPRIVVTEVSSCRDAGCGAGKAGTAGMSNRVERGRELGVKLSRKTISGPEGRSAHGSTQSVRGVRSAWVLLEWASEVPRPLCACLEKREEGRSRALLSLHLARRYEAWWSALNER